MIQKMLLFWKKKHGVIQLGHENVASPDNLSTEFYAACCTLAYEEYTYFLFFKSDQLIAQQTKTIPLKLFMAEVCVLVNVFLWLKT